MYFLVKNLFSCYFSYYYLIYDKRKKKIKMGCIFKVMNFLIFTDFSRIFLNLFQIYFN